MADDSRSEMRRLRPRVAFETAIALDFGGETHTFENTRDISMNGVYVRTARPLPVGVKAPFILTLSVGMRHERIGGVCEVMRRVSMDDGLAEEEPGPGMGLTFSSLDADSSALLYQIILHNQPD